MGGGQGRAPNIKVLKFYIKMFTLNVLNIKYSLMWGHGPLPSGHAIEQRKAASGGKARGKVNQMVLKQVLRSRGRVFQSFVAKYTKTF